MFRVKRCRRLVENPVDEVVRCLPTVLLKIVLEYADVEPSLVKLVEMITYSQYAWAHFEDKAYREFWGDEEINFISVTIHKIGTPNIKDVILQCGFLDQTCTILLDALQMHLFNSNNPTNHVKIFFTPVWTCCLPLLMPASVNQLKSPHFVVQKKQGIHADGDYYDLFYYRPALGSVLQQEEAIHAFMLSMVRQNLVRALSEELCWAKC